MKPKEADFEPQTLGEHIRKRRLVLGMTQGDAARCLNVTAATLLNWELGKTEPRIQYIPAVVRFLGYDPEPPLCTKLPEQLVAKRRTLGWTQKEAALNLGVDPCTWSDWENGGTIMVTAHRRLVAQFLGIPETELQSTMRKRWLGSHNRFITDRIIGGGKR